jgi:hypothetical protein
VNEIASTLSFVHINAKDARFQLPRRIVEVGSGWYFDEVDSVPPALGDGLLLGFCAAAEFRKGGISMVVEVGIVGCLGCSWELV